MDGQSYAVLSPWEVKGESSGEALDEERSDDVENVSEEVVDVECEDVAAVQVLSSKNHVYSLHIVYSPTYQVPVLYFNGRSQDGSLLGVEEIWGDVPQACKEHFSNSHISQGEHPVLGLPFYFIHPCNTRHLMALLVDTQPLDTSNAAYLINWLSWVSPIFGIPISILT